MKAASLDSGFEILEVGSRIENKVCRVGPAVRCGALMLAALSVSQTDQGSDVWEDIWARAVSP